MVIVIGYMGLSENSVPLHPMVLLIIIPTKWLFHWGYTPFSDIPMSIKNTNYRHVYVYPQIHIYLILPTDAVCCPDINIENVVLSNI